LVSVYFTGGFIDKAYRDVTIVCFVFVLRKQFGMDSSAMVGSPVGTGTRLGFVERKFFGLGQDALLRWPHFAEGVGVIFCCKPRKVANVPALQGRFKCAESRRKQGYMCVRYQLGGVGISKSRHCQGVVA
jgi:hypothetical protein